MGRPIPEEGAAEEEEEEGEEDEEEEFEFETEKESWEDPSEGGVLGSLFQAVEAGELDEVLRLLPACESFLRAGALGPEADTCVHLACLFKHESIFDALVDAGATLRAKDDNEGTVLHDAAASGALSIVTKLLSLAPDLANAVDSDDETALHCAARGGHLEIVAALLRAGTDKSVRNTFGQTALDCVDGEDTDTARVLADD